MSSNIKVARHETGHCVCAISCGVPFISVDVYETMARMGALTPYRPLGDSPGELTTLAGGLAADSVFACDDFMHTADSDLRMAGKILNTANPLSDVRFQRAIESAKTIVRANRNLVDSFAAKLVSAGIIYQTEAIAHFRVVTPRPPERVAMSLEEETLREWGRTTSSFNSVRHLQAAAAAVMCHQRKWPVNHVTVDDGTPQIDLGPEDMLYDRGGKYRKACCKLAFGSFREIGKSLTNDEFALQTQIKQQALPILRVAWALPGRTLGIHAFRAAMGTPAI